MDSALCPPSLCDRVGGRAGKDSRVPLRVSCLPQRPHSSLQASVPECGGLDASPGEAHTPGGGPGHPPDS